MSDTPLSTPASGRELRDLKARAQRLDPVLKIGKAGLSEAFFQALETALHHHELIKIKFEEFKGQKKELVPQLVQRSGAQLIQRVGHVAVLFKRRPPPAATA
ncbi:MAG TPA: YhbY family RNA-binding protein [Verrucomicrobiota bacterium]|nr:YhbY family RNA-binding protein [Verrucomicrobiota bacterium]